MLAVILGLCDGVTFLTDAILTFNMHAQLATNQL